MVNVLANVYLAGLVVTALFFVCAHFLLASHVRANPTDDVISWFYAFFMGLAPKYILLWPWCFVGFPLYLLCKKKITLRELIE